MPGGVDAVIDTAALHERIAPAIRDGGTLATLRGWAGDARLGVIVVPVNVRDRATDHPAIVRLREQVESGLLPLVVAATYPATAAAQAHRHLESRAVRGRVVLSF